VTPDDIDRLRQIREGFSDALAALAAERAAREAAEAKLAQAEAERERLAAKAFAKGYTCGFYDGTPGAVPVPGEVATAWKDWQASGGRLEGFEWAEALAGREGG